MLRKCIMFFTTFFAIFFIIRIILFGVGAAAVPTFSSLVGLFNGFSSKFQTLFNNIYNFFNLRVYLENVSDFSFDFVPVNNIFDVVTNILNAVTGLFDLIYLIFQVVVNIIEFLLISLLNLLEIIFSIIVSLYDWIFSNKGKVYPPLYPPLNAFFGEWLFAF